MRVFRRRPNQPPDDRDDEGIVADALRLLDANDLIGPVMHLTLVERVLVTVTEGSAADVVARVHEVLEGLPHEIDFAPPGRGVMYGPPS